MLQHRYLSERTHGAELRARIAGEHHDVLVLDAFDFERQQHFAHEGRERMAVHFDRHFELPLDRMGVVTLAENRARPKKSPSAQSDRLNRRLK